MDTARIGIPNVEFLGSSENDSATVKLELNIHGTDTLSVIELLPKILKDISSLSKGFFTLPKCRGRCHVKTNVQEEKK